MLYVPSPSGFAVEEVSSDEYHAALYDSNLDDASVDSSDGRESSVSCSSIDTVEVDGGSRESVACLAIFAGQYLMGGTTYPFWLPSTSIQDDETGITAARRLARDMLDEMSHFIVNALVRPTGLVFASSWHGSITSSVYPVNISLFNVHLSADVDRLGIITAVQQNMPRWYSNCGSLDWYGFADSIDESAQMSGLCNMAFGYLLNSRLICFYAADLVHSWRNQVLDTTHGGSSDAPLCDEHPCTCVCGSQAAANTLSLAHAQLTAAIGALRLYDEAEAPVSNQPSNPTAGAGHCVISDTSHAYHTFLVETPTLHPGSACLSCSDRGLFLCGRGLCNACCEMSGCIGELPDLCNLDANSSTTSSSGLPALESATQTRADLVEALDRALYVHEAAEFQQKPCICVFPPQQTMGPSDGCMFCSDQTVRCAACVSACVADGDASDIASAFVSGTDIHTTADGIQWIDTAHPNVVNVHHQIPYSLPNAADHFAGHLINLYHHPPFGVIPEGGYVSADSDHSSMPSLADVGSSEEWTDDDPSVYDPWDGDDSDSSTDSIPIQTRAESDSDFQQDDLDDDYDGYSSDEWDASSDTEDAGAPPLPHPADNSPPPDGDALVFVAAAPHRALSDVEARTDAADALHSALRVAESRVARSADSCSGALEYHQDTDDPDDDVWCHREPTSLTFTSAPEPYQNCSRPQEPVTTPPSSRGQGIDRKVTDLRSLNSHSHSDCSDFWSFRDHGIAQKGY